MLIGSNKRSLAVAATQAIANAIKPVMNAIASDPRIDGLNVFQTFTR
jgi:hypothetical protein